MIFVWLPFVALAAGAFYVAWCRRQTERMRVDYERRKREFLQREYDRFMGRRVLDRIPTPDRDK